MSPRALALGVATLMFGCHPDRPEPAGPDADAPAPGTAEILAASALPAELHAPLPDDPMAVTVHRLSNGITVYISPDKEQPRVTAWIGVRAGARHDPPHSTGLAHYLEHMLFKGSRRLGTTDYEAEREHISEIAELYAKLADAEDSARTTILEKIDALTTVSAAPVIPNEFERLYGALGIVGINAFTTYDATVYHCEVPAHQLRNWARVEAERFDDAVFRLFFPELESVYEEKNLSLDDPDDIVAEAQGDALFPKHPYGQQTILGEVEHLRTPAYAEMVAFFDRWYVPNNMAIVLAGDVDATDIVPALDKAFARLEPKALPPAPPGDVVPLATRTQRDVNAPGEQGVSLSWPTVPAAHPDHEGLRVLDRLLSNGSTGLIDIELVLRQELPEAGSYTAAMVEAGYVELYATARGNQRLKDAETLLVEMTRKLGRGEFTDADVDAVQLQMDLDAAYALEDPEERADLMMDAFIRRQDWPAFLEGRAARQEVDREAVVALARKYLGADYVAVHRHDGTPEREKLQQPAVTPIAIDVTRRSPFAGKVAAESGRPPPPRFLEEGRDFESGQLPTGPLVSARNRRNDLFTVTYSFERGRADDRLLCFAFDLFEVSGSPDLPAAQLQRALYRLGGSVDVDCRLRTVDVHIYGVDKNFEATLALVHGWLSAPRADKDVLAPLQANTLSDRNDTMEDPYWIGQALRDYARLGQGSPWLLVPSNKEIRRTRARPLLERVSDLSRWQRHTLYFGPRDAQSVAALLLWGAGAETPPPTRPRQLVRPEAARVVAVHQTTSKAAAWIVFGRPPPTVRERAAALVLEHYLDGDSTSLVYQQLREARGLVYSSAAWYRLPMLVGDDAELRGSFSTGNDKLVDAARVFADLLRAPPDRDRFRESRATLLRRFRLDRTLPRGVAEEVVAWRRAGFNADVREQEWAGISRVSAQAVAAFATAQTSGAPTLAVVGDLDRIGDKALARFGTVTRIEPEALFGYRR